jgi:hypothetical protein
VTATNVTGSATAVIRIEIVEPLSSRIGAFAFRVHGRQNPYVFRVSAHDIADAERVTLMVTDIWGRTVWKRVVHPARDDMNRVTWDGRTVNGDRAAPGTYIMRVRQAQ